jgi:hypothetical protein
MDPIVSVLCGSIRESVITVMNSESDKTFLVQMAMREKVERKKRL